MNLAEIWKEIDRLTSAIRNSKNISNRYRIMINSLADPNLALAEESITDLFCAMNGNGEEFRDMMVRLIEAKVVTTDTGFRKDIFRELKKRVVTLG